ncbi:MAG: vWA domain-containing protein, partial [Geminicoccaceae bacterium]
MKVPTFLTSALAALLISTSNPATAADKAVLVLDGSGSMWGQVGDTTKIEIARDVISDLMLDWSSKVELGLSAYGHREKGNCSDIETLKPIGPVDPKEVAQIVDGISPKGKTPLTAAVRNAAGELRYEEDRATVILVSDGEDTCGGDPCAVARELEAAGIDFTVHVVGFD